MSVGGASSPEQFIGHRFEPFEVTVEPGRVALFRKAIGEPATASPGDPVPPTLLGLGMDPEPFDFLDLLDLPIERLLHGEQHIVHHRVCRVGDRLRGQKEVTNLFAKKGGALLFVILTVHYVNDSGDPVCDSTQTLIITRGGTE